jgi:hypothetical protein
MVPTTDRGGPTKEKRVADRLTLYLADDSHLEVELDGRPAHAVWDDVKRLTSDDWVQAKANQTGSRWIRMGAVTFAVMQSDT